MFKFEYYDQHGGIYNSMELREDDMTHDVVAIRFTEFLRGCGYVFDSLATYRLVDNDGNVMPGFEEKYAHLMANLETDDDEEDGYTFPVV